MRELSKILCSVLYVLLIAAGTASAIQDPFIVCGYVSYDNGSAVSDASVSISVPNQVLTETMNSEGKYIGVLDNYIDGDRITVTAFKDTYTGSGENILDKSSGGSLINVILHDNETTPPDEDIIVDKELIITNITAASEKNYGLGTLDTGKLQYIDREYIFSSVPSSYADLQYIITANNDKASTDNTFLEFDVNHDVTVYVAHDDRIASKPSWLASFTDTGDDLVGGGGTFSLYADNYSAGHISLGGNTDDGSSTLRSMYNVVLKPLTDSTFINNPPELEPMLEAIGDKIVDEGQALTFTLSSTDANEDVLTFSTSNLPDGAMFNPAARTFQWTPDFTQSGTYTDVYFEVSDGTLTDFENITITVNNVNREPTFTSGPANGSIFSETESIQISIMAKDLDNDPFNYMIKIDGIQVSTTPNYTWTTNYTNSGYHNIELSVSDGTVTVTETLTIYINNIDKELVITDITVASGENYDLDTLDTGKLQYIDRNYTFRSVPPSYINLKYIRTANVDKASTDNTFLEFDVNQDVTVYVAHDDRISPKPSWLASFIDTGDDLVDGNRTSSIYANNFSAGHISLGGNTDDGSSTLRSMYNVVLKPLTDITFVNNPP